MQTTSYEAYESLTDERIRQTQAVVLAEFRDYGPMTDERLCHLLRDRMSPSGARTRRAELVDRGIIRDTGIRERLASGRRGIVWEIAPRVTQTVLGL